MIDTPPGINKFNIRVYGIFIKDSKVLLVKENMNGIEFTKFPGGGLEFGEGLLDGLKREIYEELELETEVISHFYTTDFFQQSAFYKNEQLISIYYKINIINCPDFEYFPLTCFQPGNHSLFFYWVDLNSLEMDEVTFPVDKTVVNKIKAHYFQ